MIVNVLCVGIGSLVLGSVIGWAMADWLWERAIQSQAIAGEAARHRAIPNERPVEHEAEAAESPVQTVELVLLPMPTNVDRLARQN